MIQSNPPNIAVDVAKRLAHILNWDLTTEPMLSTLPPKSCPSSKEVTKGKVV
jgi:hypothetical protein